MNLLRFEHLMQAALIIATAAMLAFPPTRSRPAPGCTAAVMSATPMTAAPDAASLPS